MKKQEQIDQLIIDFKRHEKLLAKHNSDIARLEQTASEKELDYITDIDEVIRLLKDGCVMEVYAKSNPGNFRILHIGDKESITSFLSKDRNGSMSWKVEEYKTFFNDHKWINKGKLFDLIK